MTRNAHLGTYSLVAWMEREDRGCGLLISDLTARMFGQSQPEVFEDGKYDK